MSKEPSPPMDSSRRFGVAEVLREALYLPRRNLKLMVPTMLLAFLTSTFSFMGNSYVPIYPLLLSFFIKLHLLSEKDPNTPQFYDLLLGIKHEAAALLRFDTIFMAFSYILSLLSIMIIVHSSSTTYSKKQLTATDLLSRIKGSWKGPLVTKIYFTLLYVGYSVLSISLIAIPLLKAEGSILRIAIFALLGVAARLFYVYLAMVWMVGLVISIVEEGCYGLEALDKAKDVTKGKRMQGYLIAIVFLLGDGVLNVGYMFEVTNGGGSHVVNKRGNGLVMFCVYMLLKMFSCMVYSVYYCECKMSQEKEINDVARSFTYTRVIDDTPSVDEQLA